MLLLLFCIVGFLEYETVTAKTTLVATSKAADFRSSINKEYILQYYVKANWYNANLFCRDNGMQLATINSQEEQDYLEAVIAEVGITSSFWISGADVAEEGRFSWYSNGKLLKFTNWDYAQPDNMNNIEHCIEFRSNRKWNDVVCDASLSIICERYLTQ